MPQFSQVKRLGSLVPGPPRDPTRIGPLTGREGLMEATSNCV